MNRRAPAAIGLALCAAVAGLGRPRRAQQMPDPSLIHGKALPAPELPDGHGDRARGARGDWQRHPRSGGQSHGGGRTRTARTDAQGRAEFTGLPAAQEGRAAATVDGEALVSDPFTVPTGGGLRVILVAGIAKAAKRKAAEAAAGRGGAAGARAPWSSAATAAC